jgi:hypothetical protein
MVSTTATTPEAYLASLPEDRRAAITLVRDTINAHLPPGFVEGMSHGMLGWAVPLDRFDDTYNGEPLGLAALASQKGHMSLYLNNVYGDPDTERWFRERWAATGRKLDMGKSCVRFRSVDDLPLDVIGEVIGRTDVDTYVERYREVRGSSAKSRRAGTG